MAGNEVKDKLLVVLGATGSQGGAVLRYFAKQPQHQGFHLRGVTRNRDSQSSMELRALGVEMVEADLDNRPALQKAFSGATHVFANTDSNRIIFDAIQHPEVLPEGKTPSTYAQEIEERFGMNIAIAAASTPTLQRIVWSSLASPKKWSDGRYTKVTMFDAKETIADMFGACPELRDKLSVIMIGFYTDNALRFPNLYAPQKQSDGVYELALPMSGNFQVPIAEVESDTGRWVSALFEAPPGITLVGSSERLTWEQWLTLWGNRNGVKTRYREASVEEYAAKAPGISDALAEEFRFVEEYGFAGGNSGAIYPEQLGRMGISIHVASISDHIQRCDWSSIL